MSADTMLAAVIEGPERLAVKPVPMPEYGDNEVLVRVRCVGICATDLEIYDGSMAYFTSGKATYPVIPGHEWSGEVAAVGGAVKHLSVGDRVVGETTIPCGACDACRAGRYNLCPHRVETGILGKSGAAAEYIRYPAFSLHSFGQDVAFEEACLIEPAAVAYRCAARLGITPADSVAILGAGAIGLLLVQMAHVMGAKEIVLYDLNEHRLRLGRELGADRSVRLDGSETDGSAGQGTFTKVIEASGSTRAAEFGLTLLQSGGRMGLLGLCGGKTAAIDLDKMVVGDLELQGSLGSPGVWPATIALLEARKIRLRPLITSRLPLAEFGEAIATIRRREPATIKVVIDVGAQPITDSQHVTTSDIGGSRK